MQIKNGKPFVQIGSNVGNDYFTQLCEQFSPARIILAEPSAVCFDSLKQCYSQFTCPVTIEQAAVVDSPVSEIKLYLQNHSAHSSILPMLDWRGAQFITVPAITINALFQKYNLNDIGLLFIDTEGNDARIIDSIDFNAVTIDVIYYEHWGFDDSHYQTKHHLNGLSGMSYIKAKLEALGYDVSFDGCCNYTAIKNGSP